VTCGEARACLTAHLDGELELSLSLRVDEHLAFCEECRWALAREREVRALLRAEVARAPAPAGLDARVRAALRHAARPPAGRWRRPVAWGVAAALALVAVGIGLRGLERQPPLLRELVAKHVTYSRLEAPAEIATASGEAVAGWFRERVRFDVPVPDFSPSGIRLVGGRLADLPDRPVAYLLYEKGRSLISLFAFPRRGLDLPAGGDSPDRRFFAAKVDGAEVVVWTQGELAYALVSSLDREALLECADTVWRLVAGRRAPGA
jgi:anti-sigma factor RsiW